MSVIRRGLLALILVAPLVTAASVASAPTSHADAGCNGAGASVNGNAVQTYVCLTIDNAPASPKPLSTGSSGGAPLVCWLEPQYTPAQLDSLITYESGLGMGVVGSEGGQYYQTLKTNYGGLTPPYRDGESGWWWGVGCDPANLNAETYMEQIWSEVGLDVYHPWEWVPNENSPAATGGVTVASPSMLALYAKEAATLDEPSGQMSPKYTGGTSTQTVGLPTYFWGQIGNGATPVTQHTITASVQWLSSTVTAVPDYVEVTTTGTVKGSSTIDCPVTNGQFGAADTNNATISSDCSFTYTQPSNDVTVTMVTHWTVSWPGAAGVAGWSYDETSNTVTFGGIKVQEVQTINNG